MIVRAYFLVSALTSVSLFGMNYVVTNNNDSGPGSLRQAIINSNGNVGGANTIEFAIAGSAVISLLNASGPLPKITQSVTIDGTTQPGYSALPAPIGTPAVVLNGSSIVPADFVAGFTIQDTSDCVIKGLVIQNFVGLNSSSAIYNAGVVITSDGATQANNNEVSNCYIGTNASGTLAAPNGNGGVNIVGTTPSSPDSGNCENNSVINNLISGNTNGNGITLFQNVFSTVIQGNYIGTTISGTALLPNASGIAAFGTLSSNTEQVTDTLIGGILPGQGNLISGNGTEIFLSTNVFNTIIQGNLLGTTAAGNALLYNGTNGIYLFGPISSLMSQTVTGTVIGGTETGAGNVIAGYTSGGIVLQDNIFQTTISGNFIGTDATGMVSMPNSPGILIEGDPGFPCNNNTIGGEVSGSGNLIRFNTTNGIVIDGGSAMDGANLNSILGNSIYENSEDGIALNNNGNDAQLPPSIISAGICSNASDEITIVVTAPVLPTSSNFRLEFFANPINHPSVTEGDIFLGAAPSVSTGDTVTTTLTFSPGTTAPGQYISATATNLNGAGGTPGTTSPFTFNTLIASFDSPVLTSLQTSSPEISAGGSAVLEVSFSQGSSSSPFTANWSDGTVQMNVTSPFTRTVSPDATTTYSVSISSANGCETASANITIEVSAFISSPNSIQAVVKKNVFLTQTDIVNVVTWTAPASGTPPVSYRLYRNAALTDVIATVSAADALRYLDHNRKSGTSYSYYIVAIDATGNISAPISTKIVS